MRIIKMKGDFYIDNTEKIHLLKNQLRKLNKMLKTLPEGHLSIGHSNGSYKWFYFNNGEKTYIKKSDIKLAKKLALKKYIKLKMAVVSGEINELSKTQLNLIESRDKLNTLLSDPAYIELLEDYFSTSDVEADYWMNADYNRSSSHPENLIHPTVNGIMVRSKSESMIAVALAESRIPFRYEELISINNISIAPDFTLLHPMTNKTYYWEHFGLIDNENYYENFAVKIKTYAKANIILGDNLIVTFETSDNPLSFNTISNIINQYFD